MDYERVVYDVTFGLLRHGVQALDFESYVTAMHMTVESGA